MNTKGHILALFVVVVLGIALWYFLSPVFIVREVDEEFPTTTTDSQETEKPVFPTTEELEAMTPEERERYKDEMMNAVAEEPDKTMVEPMPEATSPTSEPEALKSGEFSGADSFHRVMGNATVYQLPDGKRILRFENFEATNGPDLRVLLAQGGDPGKSIELADLKGNKGNQNYDIPEGADLSSYDSVIIYCKPFHVVFGTASLATP